MRVKPYEKCQQPVQNKEILLQKIDYVLLAVHVTCWLTVSTQCIQSCSVAGAGVHYLLDWTGEHILCILTGPKCSYALQKYTLYRAKTSSLSNEEVHNIKRSFSSSCLHLSQIVEALCFQVVCLSVPVWSHLSIQ